MKKIIAFTVLTLIITGGLFAEEILPGFEISGGVKSGLMVKMRDYSGKLSLAGHGDSYPMTLFFASQDSGSYKGEGWLGFGYNAGTWGLNLSFWAHGDLKNYNDLVHMGDHFIWANLLDGKIRFIGGQGGGTPISTGGWLNADWLSYTGLRLFWVDPLGFNIGINFPDPDNGWTAEGIKPVTYLSMIMIGASYRMNDFWISLVFDNNPIYDDTEANYDGGLHRDRDASPIAQSGNVGFGVGVENIFAGKGVLAFDGMITNLGEDDVSSIGSRSYKISPVKTILALKAGYPINDNFYAEIKGKYQISQGDNEDRTASITWGRFEFEPYVSYRIIDNLRFELAFNYAAYVNSYYLAAEITPNASIGTLSPGQTAAYPSALDYLSPFQLSVKPALNFSHMGASIAVGYNCSYSRDFIDNTLFIDFRWSF